jgi:hypothetical protein
MIIAIPDHPIQNLRLRISGGTAQRSGRTPLAPVIFQAGALFTQTVTNSLADSISYITPISLPFSFCFFFRFGVSKSGIGKVGDVCKVTPAWSFQL